MDIKSVRSCQAKKWWDINRDREKQTERERGGEREVSSKCSSRGIFHSLGVCCERVVFFFVHREGDRSRHNVWRSSAEQSLGFDQLKSWTESSL